MKKKLLLINPNDTTLTYGEFKLVGHITKKSAAYACVALATVAALTPKDRFDVVIVDDRIEPIDFDGPWDLVGITGYSNHVHRIAEIAGEFRKRGVPVVCGGAGVTIDPERWRPFADVLIRGEAERIWPRFLQDFVTGSYDAEYRDDEKFDLCVTPPADYSSIADDTMRKYQAGIVQTSRGCPFNCDFCDAIVYAGRKTRYKRTEVVLGELENLYARGIRYVFLGDDNFSANRKRAKEILRAISDWNRGKRRPVILATALTIDVARDDEFLRLAAEAGLTRVFVGLESVNEESLRESNKLVNLRGRPEDDVRRFQEHGIVVLGGCMVGFDHDDLSIFRKQFAFFSDLGIPNVFVIPVHAADGTPLKRRMVEEGRYIDYQTEGGDGGRQIDIFRTFTIVPKQMSVKQLQQGAYWLGWKLYEPENFLQRLDRFFRTYEASSVKDSLDIPTGYDADGLLFLLRLVKHVAFRAPAWERRLLWGALRVARTSSHPQKWEIALSGSLFVINARANLQTANPRIADVTYPGEA